MSLFKKSNILVIGDAMLDKYTFGHTNRISPEAPVPVLKVEKEILKPGGAANVASNISSLGLKTSLVSEVGIDENGKALRKIIKSQKINLISKSDKNYNTITKTRIISQNQQLIRIDNECSYTDNFNNYHPCPIPKNTKLGDCKNTFCTDLVANLLLDSVVLASPILKFVSTAVPNVLSKEKIK